jgi:Ring finger domain
MFPVSLDLGFWFCESAHDFPCALICRVLVDDQQFPFRTFVTMITFLFLAVTQIIFYAWCMIYPSWIHQYCFSPSNQLLIDRDDAGQYREPTQHLLTQKNLIRSDPNFMLQPYSETESVNEECSICLYQYSPEDEVLRSRHCRHAFHEDCLAAWLWRHSTCPCCRVPVLNGKQP